MEIGHNSKKMLRKFSRHREGSHLQNTCGQHKLMINECQPWILIHSFGVWNQWVAFSYIKIREHPQWIDVFEPTKRGYFQEAYHLGMRFTQLWSSEWFGWIPYDQDLRKTWTKIPWSFAKMSLKWKIPDFQWTQGFSIAITKISYPNFSHSNHLVAYRDAHSCTPGHFHGFEDHLGPFGRTFCCEKWRIAYAAMIYLVFVLLWHDVLQTSVYTNRIMVNLLFC